VHVHHAVGVLGGQRDRVRTADEEMAGVNAQADPRAGENPLGLLTRLHHGPHVRVHAGDQATRGGPVGDPVEVAEHHRPAGIVENRARVVPLDAGERGQDHHAGS
jgi:hypothetical protein